jgi:hypothetical protein
MPARGARLSYWGAAGVNGFDDLGVVDALQVDGGDAEVAVAELALDDDQRDALARHLDGVSVTELVWCEAPAHPGRHPLCVGVARAPPRSPRAGRPSLR